METELLKVEVDMETCCVCGEAGEELYWPEEYEAGAPPAQTPLRAMLLHLNNSKVVPNGKLCTTCIRKTIDSYNFSTTLASKGPPSLSEKIRALRKRLHELTQKIDVFIVVGGAGGAGGAGGGYSEEDIIMVEREALAAARRADDAELLQARSLRGEHVYQCTVCPLTFQRAAEYRSHVGTHEAGALHSCWTCGAQFASHAAAAAHAAAHRPDAALVCYLCNETFTSQAEQRRHEAGGACPAVCPAAGCARTFESRAALRAHAAAAHAALCGVCLRAFPSPAALHAHALAHRQARQYVCGYDGCILRFTTRNNLLSHIRKCHGSELQTAGEAAGAEAAPGDSAPAPGAPVACDKCDRTFATAAAMKRHARVHRAERDHTQQGGMEWSGEGAEGEGKVEYLEVETLEDLEDNTDMAASAYT